MTTYMKSITIKRGYSKASEQGDKDAKTIQHLKVISKDSKVEHVELNGILDRANEISIE